MTTWRMGFACWLTKAKKTHTHNIQGVSGGIINILVGGSMDYSE